MSHLPYVIAAYSTMVLFTAFLSLNTWIRLRHAQNRLEQLKKLPL